MVNFKFNCNHFRSDTEFTTPQHIHTEHTGKHGQPKKHVDPKVLHEAFQKGRRIPVSVLASILGIDQKTLRVQMQEMGIDHSYDDISDQGLNALVQQYLQENPRGGHAYVIGCLHAAHSLCIQHHRVIKSMKQVDCLGVGIRKQVGEKKKRTCYKVPWPNSLWHIDGHHKLIALGIVIHGIVHGYSRKVCKHDAAT